MKIGSHLGTHIDAPKHFYEEGTDIANIALEKTIGPCKVACNPNGDLLMQWVVTADLMKRLISDGTKKLLLKGNVLITHEASIEMVAHHIDLIGVEGQTVGPEDAPAQVHYTLLKDEIVIFECVRLSKVPCGDLILYAAPQTGSASVRE